MATQMQNVHQDDNDKTVSRGESKLQQEATVQGYQIQAVALGGLVGAVAVNAIAAIFAPQGQGGPLSFIRGVLFSTAVSVGAYFLEGVMASPVGACFLGAGTALIALLWNADLLTDAVIYTSVLASVVVYTRYMWGYFVEQQFDSGPSKSGIDLWYQRAQKQYAQSPKELLSEGVVTAVVSNAVGAVLIGMARFIFSEGGALQHPIASSVADAVVLFLYNNFFSLCSLSVAYFGNFLRDASDGILVAGASAMLFGSISLIGLGNTITASTFLFIAGLVTVKMQESTDNDSVQEIKAFQGSNDDGSESSDDDYYYDDDDGNEAETETETETETNEVGSDNQKHLAVEDLIDA